MHCFGIYSRKFKLTSSIPTADSRATLPHLFGVFISAQFSGRNLLTLAPKFRYIGGSTNCRAC